MNRKVKFLLGVMVPMVFLAAVAVPAVGPFLPGALPLDAVLLLRALRVACVGWLLALLFLAWEVEGRIRG